MTDEMLDDKLEALQERFDDREIRENRARKKRDKKKPTNRRGIVERDEEALEVAAEKQVIDVIADKPLQTAEKPKLEWYPKMLDDLRLATFPDGELNVEEREERYEAAERLREKGINLPRLSLDYVENNPKIILRFQDRQKVRAAAEFLRDPSLKINDFWNRAEALNYLTSLRIDIKQAQEQSVVEEMPIEHIQDGEALEEREIEINNILAGLKKDSDVFKWESLTRSLVSMPKEERLAQLGVLKILQHLRENPHLIEGNQKIKDYWDTYHGILGDMLGIKI